MKALLCAVALALTVGAAAAQTPAPAGSLPPSTPQASAAAQRPNAPTPMPGPVGVGYGPPIGLSAAQRVLTAAETYAARNNIAVAIAIVDPSGDLVAFTRTDDVARGSIALAQRKASTSALFRRDTMVYLQSLNAGNLGVLTLDVAATPGGKPLVENDRVIGAIGVSGGLGMQDVDVAAAGAAALQER